MESTQPGSGQQGISVFSDRKSPRLPQRGPRTANPGESGLTTGFAPPAATSSVSFCSDTPSRRDGHSAVSNASPIGYRLRRKADAATSRRPKPAVGGSSRWSATLWPYRSLRSGAIEFRRCGQSRPPVSSQPPRRVAHHAALLGEVEASQDAAAHERLGGVQGAPLRCRCGIGTFPGDGHLMRLWVSVERNPRSLPALSDRLGAWPKRSAFSPKNAPTYRTPLAARSTRRSGRQK